MSTSRNEKTTPKKNGLRSKLIFIEFLVIVIPAFILLYIYHSSDISLKISHVAIIALTLVLILGGLLLLRQLFDRFATVATLLKKGEVDKNSLAEITRGMVELREITASFNDLKSKLEESTNELGRRVFELFALKELTEVASKSLNIDDLLNLLLEKAMAVSSAQNGSVFLVEPGTDRFRIAASRGSESKPEKDLSININDSLARSVVHDKKPLLVQDIESDSRTRKPNDPKYVSPSFISMPILVKEKIIGVMNLSDKDIQKAFDSKDEQILSLMITEIGFALENAELHLAIGENLKKLQNRTTDLVSANDQLQQQITERKRAEKALEETNKLLKNILDSSSSISIISTDLDGIILFWNKGAEQIFGYTTEETVGRQKIDILYDDDETRQATKEIRTFILENKKETSCELKEVSKDGRKLWIKMNLTPTFDEKGNINGILGIGEDVTKSKHLEEALHQTQKMEAIGTLAGGTAHDFNNLLMAIQGNASLMLLETDPEHPNYQKLKNIVQYVKNGSDLTSQLLGFARGGKYEVRPTDINELIKKTCEMFSPTKKEIKIHETYQNDLWTAEVDQGQIDQVVLNLFVNAGHAMTGGGDLYIQTENIILDESYVRSLKIEPGKYVKISVTDTGVGMDEETQQRIFEPFFTTKQMGRGTGLGLASAYGIVKNHGGYINVESEKGVGTTFTIFLSASDAEAVEEKESAQEAIKGNEIILLVDNGDMIIDVDNEMIDKMGYTVLLARSGKEALEIYQNHQDIIDIVILEMIMPDMDGGEVFNAMKDIDPDVKVLLSSGYSINGQATDILERGCRGFIQKPFSIEDLSQKIREVLDRD